MSEYRDLVREQMAAMEMEMPGIQMEYRENVARIGEMEVDVLIQEISVPETQEPMPFPLQQTEVHYGWGEEELWTVMGSGDAMDEGVDRLRELASRRPGPIPDHLQPFLDSCPEDLLLFGWLDLSTFVQGISAMIPTPPGPGIPEGFPPIVFYATSEGARVVYGGSMDLKSMVSVASRVRRQ